MSWIKNVTESPTSLIKKVSCGLIIAASLYAIAPSLSALVFGDSKQSIGKYTTVGLINRGNDCFITSSLQGLAGIPRFVEYLKRIRTVLLELETKLSNNAKGDNPTVDNTTRHSRLENSSNSLAPLHESLTSLILDLISVKDRKTSISPKIVINTLESIFKLKISSKQNDAHEFTLILLQTLQEERSKLIDYSKQICNLNIPKFPFEGETSKFLVCLKCKGLSEPSYQQTFIRELSVPQQTSENLSNILAHDETEIIDDYSCLICQIRAILNHEEYKNFKDCTPDEILMLDRLKNYATKAPINENLPFEVEQYVKRYSKGNLQVSNIKGKVIKKDVVVQLPDILIVHLSRSTFNGITYSRNPCNVKFGERITLSEYTLAESGTITENRQVKYNLKSVVKHTGSHSSGHYMCYRRKTEIRFGKEDESSFRRAPVVNNEVNKNREQNVAHNDYKKSRYKKVKNALRYPYWQISDTAIKESTASTVLNEQKYAYMLYYERVNK
ncbi:unnamed protein product [Saccharomyces cerevisiae]|nr:unnamed protein product [Saccharomyces cerevisiae]GMC45088.1 unnamed protein product [Saccharomyces cerevisiae]CAI5338998.1 BBF_HP2_G0054090.mRNA.1.CDS.1 [Saccharomyces cerevisiae]CAI6815863.1 BBF_HP2_G0054090.mRNA.1.CDS.1 [Saccharomyces cerevisiae]CAI6831689.1 BBF_HP1_G0056070.mRNA.1.CDS.1 [Saccharomyces cerevisiae]